ncbi:DUF2069 domain-containing protein [Trinickia soli]|uniref:DUF2069 domain-containing protein n=1 Tax=Trinickia soli TaxID=380675 RepID=A0A2N7VSZ3_9BURK|nr:DUF2069 domain-containing protein [Trinickia soli]KAA0082979.1 DUF2069 domain-containing protein [Paraburkholderia sp. T12-10]PMS20252.1 DUF2069 domain-containing protein [Trinickia soli]CAB3715563.1 hypothetical protein LMG24076_04270 [Trinickia soli]
MTPGHTDTANAAAAPASAVAPRDRCALGALFALVALIVLAVAWERWLAPLRPGGSALVLKALPLVCALPGVWRRKLYTLQWASMLVLLYLAEGIVRGMTDGALSARLGWAEVALATLFIACAVAYVAPFKRAARAARRDAGSGRSS